MYRLNSNLKKCKTLAAILCNCIMSFQNSIILTPSTTQYSYCMHWNAGNALIPHAIYLRVGISEIRVSEKDRLILCLRII